MSKEGTYEPDASGLPRTRHLSTVSGDKIGLTVLRGPLKGSPAPLGGS